MQYRHSAFVAAFLAALILTPGRESPILAAESTVGDPILPRVLAHLQHDHDALQLFSFREASRLERRDKSGELRSSESVISEIFYDEGHRMRRSLVPGDPEEGNARPATADREPTIDLKGIASCFRFETVGSETLDGRPALRIAFAARADCMSEGGRVARILGHLAGDLWLDSEGFDLLRLEGTLQKPVTFGFGLLGRIDVFDITLSREAVSHGVFAVTRIDYHARGRTFPVRRFDMQMTRERSQFRAHAGATRSSATSIPSRQQTSHRGHRPRNRS